MELGKPFSQPCGVFQGRSDAFSDSVLAQPPKAIVAKTKSRRNAQRELAILPLMMQDGRG
jgi:hypothetical protein